MLLHISEQCYKSVLDYLLHKKYQSYKIPEWLVMLSSSASHYTFKYLSAELDSIQGDIDKILQ